jgi:antitoxin CptB
MDTASRIRRLKFRAWHRGTREADYLLGGFFDRYHTGWSELELAWFEELLEEEDVDVLAWAMAAAEVPDRFAGAQMAALQRLDYVKV